MRPFNSLTGTDVQNLLQLPDCDSVRQLVAAAVLPAPDAGVCDAKNATTWAWNVSTIATATTSLTPASLSAALLRANSPLPDGSPAVKPYIAAVNSTWAN